jgi:hypothetical protein
MNLYIFAHEIFQSTQLSKFFTYAKTLSYTFCVGTCNAWS